MKKRTWKTVIDIVMVICLPVLMAYQLVGEALHEWIGMVMFGLFLVHQGLNISWHKNLFKGKWNFMRIAGTVLDLLLILIMAALPISGIMQSKHLFAFLPFHGADTFARTVHLLASYWGYVLMSLHLGFHWSMVVRAVKKRTDSHRLPGFAPTGMRLLAVLIAGYGVYAFHTRQLGSYMLLKTRYVFFDFEEPLILFFVDYLAIMGLCIFLGYYLSEAMKSGVRVKRLEIRRKPVCTRILPPTLLNIKLKRKDDNRL